MRTDERIHDFSGALKGVKIVLLAAVAGSLAATGTLVAAPSDRLPPPGRHREDRPGVFL